MHLQLTISLLVSNKFDHVRRCLDSLVPILMRLPSELIVVDTSENVHIKELALQYTDQVISFRWCDDFSKARNIGLQAARGEWFMYIDDDEWFENTDEIVDFFVSGEYLGYNSANYIVRNYTRWDGTEYVDAHLSRMARRVPASRFVNPIHEYITPFIGPTKIFSAYVHHYGYVRKISETKTNRNIPLLQKELETNIPTVHNYLQMCQEYMADEKYAEAEEYAFKCLGLEEDDKQKEKSWCIAYIPHLIYKQRDYQRALKVGNEMLRHPFCTEIASLRIYADLIAVCENLEGYEKNIIIYARSYHHNLSRLDERMEQWGIQSIGGLGEQQSKSIKDTVCLAGLSAAVRIRDERASMVFMEWLPWGEPEAEKFYPWFFAILHKDGGDEEFLLRCFERMDAEDAFVFINKAKKAWNDGDQEAAQKYYSAAACSDNGCISREAVLLFFVSEGNVSLELWMDSMDLHQWEDVSGYIAEKAEIEDVGSWISTVEKYLDRYPIQTLSVLIPLQKKLLIEGVWEIGDQEIFMKVEQYCKWVQQYYFMLYNKDVLYSQHIHLVPRDHRFALQMDSVFQDLQRGDHLNVLKGLRQAIEILPSFCGVIRRMLSTIEMEMKRPDRSDGEFEILGIQIKKMIQDLLQEGRYVEAMPLIQQLSSLLPGDLEVLRSRQRLWTFLQDENVF